MAAGDVRYAGVSNFVGWQTAQAATWQPAFPRPAADHERTGGVLAAGPARRGGGDPGRPRLRDGPVPVVADRTGGAHRQVPHRASPRLPRRVAALRLVRRALPRAALPSRRGRRRHRGGRPGSHVGAGRPALGAGRAGGHRSPARCPDHRPVGAVPGHRGARVAGRDRRRTG